MTGEEEDEKIVSEFQRRHRQGLAAILRLVNIFVTRCNHQPDQILWRLTDTSDIARLLCVIPCVYLLASLFNCREEIFVELIGSRDHFLPTRKVHAVHDREKEIKRGLPTVFS